MSDPLEHLRAPRAPDDLRDRVLAAARVATADPTSNPHAGDWLDRFLAVAWQPTSARWAWATSIALLLALNLWPVAPPGYMYRPPASLVADGDPAVDRGVEPRERLALSESAAAEGNELPPGWTRWRHLRLEALEV